MRVLIADDDPIIRLDLKQMLENLGYEVVAEAGDGQQAVELAKAFGGDNSSKFVNGVLGTAYRNMDANADKKPKKSAPKKQEKAKDE